jgi:alpha-L-rhamnosidase
MHPRPGGGLTSIRAELCSVYGLIRSAWSLENGFFEWQIRVPPNTTATVFVPVGEGGAVREGDVLAQMAPGVSFLYREAGEEVYEVVSGDYLFRAA